MSFWPNYIPLRQVEAEGQLPNPRLRDGGRVQDPGAGVDPGGGWPALHPRLCHQPQRAPPNRHDIPGVGLRGGTLLPSHQARALQWHPPFPRLHRDASAPSSPHPILLHSHVHRDILAANELENRRRLKFLPLPAVFSEDRPIISEPSERDPEEPSLPAGAEQLYLCAWRNR